MISSGRYRAIHHAVALASRWTVRGQARHDLPGLERLHPCWAAISAAQQDKMVQQYTGTTTELKKQGSQKSTSGTSKASTCDLGCTRTAYCQIDTPRWVTLVWYCHMLYQTARVRGEPCTNTDTSTALLLPVVVLYEYQQVSTNSTLLLLHLEHPFSSLFHFHLPNLYHPLWLCCWWTLLYSIVSTALVCTCPSNISSPPQAAKLFASKKKKNINLQASSLQQSHPQSPWHYRLPFPLSPPKWTGSRYSTSRAIVLRAVPYFDLHKAARFLLNAIAREP
jgi:hypothetical protein